MARTLSPQQIAQKNDRLEILSAVVPGISAFFGQIVMLIVMVFNKQYLYLVFLIPGIISAFAISVIMFLRWRMRKSLPAAIPETDHGSTGSPCSSGTVSLDPVLSIPPKNVGKLLPARNLSQLYGTALTDWRNILRLWLGHSGTGSPASCPARGSSTEAPVGTALFPAAEKPADSMAGSAGRRDIPPQEALCQLDLIRQGPHALIAGTTGSGKSVFLETWCLSLACSYPPDQLNLVFLDFKGGATFQRLKHLPHTVGNVSDLNIPHAMRALRALEYELKRREQIVQGSGGNSILHLKDAPAHLIIVIDEFHALRDALPDYIPRLISLAALGRSLGIHVIACTQNPMSQISNDMKANLSLHICLRVRDTMQSLELLDIPHAAALDPRSPGAGYIHDGVQCVPFRSAYSADIADIVKAAEDSYRFMVSARSIHTRGNTSSDTGNLSTGSNSNGSTGTREAGNHLPLLFSAPLPAFLQSDPQPAGPVSPCLPSSPWMLDMGLKDNGITTSPWRIPLQGQNIAVIAPHGFGKTAFLRIIRRSYMRRLNAIQPAKYHDAGILIPRIAVCDNADPYLDPLTSPAFHAFSGSDGDTPAIDTHTARTVNIKDHSAGDTDTADRDVGETARYPFVTEIRSAEGFYACMGSKDITLFYTVSDPRAVHYPQNCDARIAIPTGERSTDILCDLPGSLANDASFAGKRIPGRGIYCADESYIIQTYTDITDI